MKPSAGTACANQPINSILTFVFIIDSIKQSCCPLTDPFLQAYIVVKQISGTATAYRTQKVGILPVKALFLPI